LVLSYRGFEALLKMPLGRTVAFVEVIAAKECDRESKNSKIRHQNWVVFELFSDSSSAEKLDRERVFEWCSSSFTTKKTAFCFPATLYLK
jgi:hypothetical protein